MRIFKQLMAFMLMVALCLSPVQVSAAMGDFVISDGVLTKYTGSGGSVVIPNGVTSIGWGAFSNCTNLTSVTIPNSVTSIQSRAFWHTGLVTIEVPSSVTSIGEFVFSIESLVEISVAPENPKYSSKDGVLYDKNQTTLLVYPSGKTEVAFQIPEGVTKIEKWAYVGNWPHYEGNLASIYLPTSVSSIGECAFNGDKIKNIYFSGSKEQWKNIVIDDHNPSILSATVRYNSHRDLSHDSDSPFQKVKTYKAGQFSDVLQTDWYYENVRTVYEYGLMSGATETSFDPKGNLTVAEAISIASQLYNLTNGGKACFAPGNPWYQSYVDYALDQNIISAQYDYEAPVSRGDFALFINNSLPNESLKAINEISELDIPDVFPLPPMQAAITALRSSGTLAFEDAIPVAELLMRFEYQMGGRKSPEDTDVAIYRLYCAGITAGNDEYGTFTPDASITRGAAASIISRVIEPSQRLNINLKPKPASLVPLNRLENLPSIQKKLSRAQLTQAYEEARQIVEPLADLPIEAQLGGIALAIRIRNDKKVTYSMSAPHYNDPYGFFVTGNASCAGSTRATGLCLNMLGISYEHVNEDQFGHQWARVNVNGTYWICDAFGLYCGPEKEAYKHPVIS